MIPRAVDDPALLPAPRRKVVLKAPRSGFVRSLAARPVGHATMLLGAGRARMDSPVDHAVGVILHKKVGDSVAVDEPLCTLLVNDESRLHGGGSADPGRLHHRRGALASRSRSWSSGSRQRRPALAALNRKREG